MASPWHGVGSSICTSVPSDASEFNACIPSRPVRMYRVAFQSMSWLGTAKLVSTQQEQKGVDEEGSLDTEDTEESKLEVCTYARERWQG